MRNIKEIKKNLDGNTSEQEYAIFKERMRTDHVLAGDVVTYLNAKLKAADVISQEGIIPFYQKKIVWWAAASLIFMMSSFAIYNHNESPLRPGPLLGRNKTAVSQSVTLSDSSANSLKKTAHSPSKNTQ